MEINEIDSALRDRIRVFETLEQTEGTLEPRHDPRLFLADEPSTRKFPDFDKTKTVPSTSMWTFRSIFIKRPMILSLNKLIRKPIPLKEIFQNVSSKEDGKFISSPGSIQSRQFF